MPENKETEQFKIDAVEDTKQEEAREDEKPSVEDPEDLPDIDEELPELKIYSHSPIFYWWPVWAVGYVMAFFSFLQGRAVRVEGGDVDYVLASNNFGVIYVAVLLVVIIFTNVKLRGIYSVATILGIAFVAVLFAWLDWWDDIFAAIPELSVRMNMGFYLVMSTGLLIVWLLSFFLFDRLTYWRIRPGQMTEEHLVGAGERSYDTRGMLFEKHGEDFFRHVVLGFGAGDLQISTTGARKENIYIQNVLFADRKVRTIQKLISVQPDDLVETPTPKQVD